MIAINHSQSNTVDSKSLKLLFKHGMEVFGTEENFVEWLKRGNFFFGKKAPLEFLNINEGIKFIDDRLTGIEYGDNA